MGGLQDTRPVDLARGRYELEVQTTLGESMARLTEAQWHSAQADFELALGWARLHALLGREVRFPLEAITQ